MPVAICTHCGAKAEAATVDELEVAIPGHPFLTGQCPTRRASRARATERRAA